MNPSYRVPIPTAALIVRRLQPKARVLLNRCLKESVKPPQGVSPLLGSFHPLLGLRLGKYSVWHSNNARYEFYAIAIPMVMVSPPIGMSTLIVR